MTLDPDSAHRDSVEHAPKDAPRLVTAQDIARERIAAMPADTITQRLRRANAFAVETERAKAELEKGEWQRP